MKTLWTLIAVVLLGAAARPDQDPAGKQPVDLEAAYQEAVEAFVLDLHDFADWCNSVKLYVERDKALEAVLLFVPDDFDAHRVLKHKQLRDGTWEIPEDRVASRNYEPRNLRACAVRRSKVVVAFRDGVLELLEEAEEPDPALRDRAFAAVLAVDPSDPEIRARRGEVADPDVEEDALVWVLEETLRGRQRRGALKSSVRDALKAAGKASESEPGAEDAALAVTWKSTVATAAVRVLSTGAAAEAARVAQSCEAAGHFVRSAFGTEAALPEGFTIYLLLSDADRDAFVDGYPDLTDEDRELYRSLVGTGLPGFARAARWDPGEPHRLDGAVRFTIGRLLNGEYGVWLEPGWVWEGFGLYLTRQMTGTRLTWYVEPRESQDPEVEKLRATMGESQLNWMNEAFQLTQAGKATPLAEFLVRPLNEMTVADVLVAYAFAAYLLEGAPDATPEILARIGAGTDPVRAVSSGLGRPLPEIEARFVRWLSERR